LPVTSTSDAKIMLQGQNFNTCSWGLMNSNYNDTDFTYNIYTSLRSNRILTLCLNHHCPQQTSVKVTHSDGQSLHWQVLCTAHWGELNSCIPLWCKQFKYHMQQPHTFLRVYWDVLPANNPS
jgi:hypothetical protein